MRWLSSPPGHSQQTGKGPRNDRVDLHRLFSEAGAKRFAVQPKEKVFFNPSHRSQRGPWTVPSSSMSSQEEWSRAVWDEA